MKRDRVILSSSAERVVYVPAPRRPGRFRRALRIGFLLAVFGLVRVARNPRWRFALSGAVLTVAGLLVRAYFPVNLILLLGLMGLLYAPFLPGDTVSDRKGRARLRRELAAYSTPAERRDLEALLMQYSDQETGELRAILASQDLADHQCQFPGLGH
jgi:hypothetical protein